MSLGDDVVTVSGVDVTAGATTPLEESVDWKIHFAETVTVGGSSDGENRRGTAAITRVDGEEIERQASHGQLPKLLEFSPGVDVTQSGIYDYNLNARGFNSVLTRRVAFLIDGRDAPAPTGSSRPRDADPSRRV